MQKLDKSKLVNNLGKRYKLVPFLDKALMTFEEEWEFKYEPKKGDTAWHPSGHCTPPVSVLYAEAKVVVDELNANGNGTLVYDGPPPPESTAMRKTFQVGHFWHQLLQHIVLHKLEFCTPDAIEVRGKKEWANPDVFYYGGSGDGIRLPKPYHWTTGSGDIAPLVLPSKWEGVVDFKTMGSQQFKQPGIPSWIGDKYECQINIYMDFFDLEHGLIVAINKDSPHDMKEFEFVRNQPLIDAIYEKWEFISDCIDHDVEITEDDDNYHPLPTAGPVS